MCVVGCAYTLKLKIGGKIMACNCLQRVSKEIDEKIDSQIDKIAKNGIHEMDEGKFKNTTLVSREGVITEKGVMLYVREYLPLRQDGSIASNRKKASYNIIFSFCPFCGEQMDKEDQ